jgi:hypothetical protein
MRVGDLVVTTMEAEATFDGTKIVVKIGPGHIGRIMWIDDDWITSHEFATNNVLVSFEGNAYWVKGGALKLVEVLDEMAEFGK